jgi:hypothetical protein
MANKEVAFKIVVDTSEVGEGVEKSVKSVEELGDATKKTSDQMKSGFKAAEKGTKGLGSSIGGVIKSLGLIGVAMAVFEFMKDIVSKNQKIMDALSTATTALEIIINKLFQALEPVVDAMIKAFKDPKGFSDSLGESIDGLITRFRSLGGVVSAAGDIINGVLSFDWAKAAAGTAKLALDWEEVKEVMGETWESVKEGVVGFVNDISSATQAALDQADALVALRNEVALADIEQRKLQLTYQNEAELQRQIRDDISKTIEERKTANQELSRILKKQLKEETAQAQKKLDLANLEIAANGKRQELLEQRGEAELALFEVLERVNSQESEQKTNKQALEKELFDLQQEIRSATLLGREKELEDLDIYYEALAEKARLAGDTSTDIAGARTKAISELNDKFRKEDLASEQAHNKKIKDEEEKLKKIKIQAALDVGSALGSIASAVENQGKAGLAASKVLAISELAISTAVSIGQAIAGATSAASAGGPAAPFLLVSYISTMVGTVVGAIASATSILNKVPAGGSAVTPSVNVSSASAAPPSFNPVTTNTTDLGNTNQAELMPIQAFVVETQVTGSQNNINQIQGQAEFGGG